ncbi:potassium channel family protein [soil metagenome]
MQWGLGVLGVVIILLVLGDVVKTTLSVRGSGLGSGWLARTTWTVALWWHRRRPAHGALAYVGTATLLLIIGLWTSALWLGWTLFFMSDLNAVVSSSSGEPTGFVERAYFVGYTLITLGNGEYQPQVGFWQIMTLLAASLGFFVITLAITFLLSVLPAVVGKRQLASYIASLGLAPADIVLGAWDGDSCDALTQHLSTLNEALGKVAQQHLAFPILHYFHSGERRTALPLRVAALDEALGCLFYGLEGCQSTAHRLQPLRESVGSLLETLQNGFIGGHDDTPPPTPLEPLREGGLETKAQADYHRALDEKTERRKLLHGYVVKDGWEWQDIFKGED